MAPKKTTGNRANAGLKRGLVVWRKPSIIRTAEDWERTTARPALDDFQTRTRRIITVNGSHVAPPPSLPATPKSGS